jgi:shikimate kinase
MQSEDPAQRLAELMGQRRPLYAQADLHIVQDGRPPDQVAEQILEALPGVLKERSAAPQHRLQVRNEAGEVRNSIN